MAKRTQAKPFRLDRMAPAKPGRSGRVKSWTEHGSEAAAFLAVLGLESGQRWRIMRRGPKGRAAFVADGVRR